MLNDESRSAVLGQDSRPRILLVDDDVTFGKIMKKMADKLDLPLQYLSSVNDLASITGSHFDVGIFDYDLGTVTGVQLSDIVEKYLGKIPIILVSAYNRIETRKWPQSVTGFIPKSEGFHAILAEACRVFNDKKERTSSSETGSERVH